MYVIGTAGHVDHGKSTLVEALTGTHPDRLKEEREREMTIDLGFAWLTLPNGEEVGIVDVPGHRDFIENMLAGVGSIDATMFVIAADEGVMPQTREHLAILDILQIQGGVVVLTKIDLVEDEEWLDLVEDDIRKVLDGTVLNFAPIVRVSALNRQGIPKVIEVLSKCLVERPPRPDLGRPRLPVDRVFTIAGFGTVVTGTLTDGQLRTGEEIEILPSGKRGRVRGLQTHKKKEEIAVPGSRTAVNISGVTVDQIKRGDVVAHSDDFRSTGRIDAQFRLLPDVIKSVKHNTEVKLFIGAAEVVARLRLLGTEELMPGETGWLQMESKQKIFAVRGDRFILRRPSPSETIGGGVVVDSHPKGRHKRFSAETLSRLEALARGTPADVLLQALLSLGAAPLKDVIAQSNLNQMAVAEALDELLANRQLLFLPKSEMATEKVHSNELVISKGYWDQLSSSVIRAVENYHIDHPLRKGMPREELKSRLKVSQRLFNATISKLVAEDDLSEEGPWVFRPEHEVRFNPDQKRAVGNLLAHIAELPYSPPSVKECQSEVGEEVFNALVDRGQLVMVSSDVVFNRKDYEDMVNDVQQLLLKRGTIKASEVRDYFNTSRKYALALLEHLDKIGITVREGDLRRLGK